MGLDHPILGRDTICREVSTETLPSSDTQALELDDPVILCRSCQSLVSAPEFQIEVNHGFSHTFANPLGHVFEIGCFSQARGCVAASSRSNEFSWFPGYDWQIGICRSCQAHLGWIFSGNMEKFFGLILDKLIFP